MNSYKEITIKFNKKNYNKIYEQLYLSGIHSILEESDHLKFSYPQNSGTKELIKTLLSNCNLTKDDIRIKLFRNKNWNLEWQKSIKPVFIDRKIIIYPSWLKREILNFKDRILIQIDPKMSFGTGHNETTQLVLKMMCEFIDNEDKKMLDYGCGTGVLAIAGIGLGITNAIAIDNDEEAIDNAKEYFKINKVNKKIKLAKKNISQIRERNFDIICANLISSVITESIDCIYEKLKVKGKLILSGILEEEENKICRLLQKKNFVIKKILHKAEWISIYAIKKK